MKKFDEMRYFAVKREINRMVAYKDAEYANGVIASAFAYGRENELTEDWLRRHLLGEVEDEFLTYGQALALNPIYLEAIAKLKRIFG